MATEDVISPRKTMFVLVVVVGCFAVLWPRLLYPVFVGNVRDQIRPNKFDKEAGCCNMIFETDVNAIRIMIELCGNLLERHGNVDERIKLAFRTGKLPRDIVAKCREEVNSTCGVDISVFLDANIRLGKTYKQLLDEIRSYNSSNCLKMNYGVPPWALGVPHIVANLWNHPKPVEKFIRQERSPYLHPTSGPHPAMRERGRAIATSGAPLMPTPPSQGPVPLIRRSAEGRVGLPHTLTQIYQKQEEPVIPGMRPPMGGAGHIVPPPKSSTMGLFMPLYTTGVVVFFVYTLTKLLFRKQAPDEVGPYEHLDSDPEFRRRVFQGVRTPISKYTQEPAPKLVVSAISGLVAEVRQQMEETKPAHTAWTDLQQDLPVGAQLSHTNGSIITSKYPLEESYNSKDTNSYFSDTSSDNVQKERTPIKDLILVEETTPQIELEQKHLEFEKYTYPDPESGEATLEALLTSELVEAASELRATTPETREFTPELRETTPEAIIEKRVPNLRESSPDVNDWCPVVREPSPEEVSPEPEDLVEEYEIENENELLQKADILFREPTPQPSDLIIEPKENAHGLREPIIESDEVKLEETLEDEYPIEDLQLEDVRKSSSELKESSPILREYSPIRQESPIVVQYDDYEEAALDEVEERPESPAHRQLRSSVENDRATVKVLGMEMTASCSDGAVWGNRPRSPGPAVASPMQALGAQVMQNPARQRTPSPPVSAIFLEGPALPHQSRLLVTDSETRTEMHGDSPVVLSGKMTLSVINDESAKSTPDRDSEDTVNGADDEDFTTASAATVPKQILQDDEGESEEEVEEEIEEEEEEELDEEVEVEETEELEDDRLPLKRPH